MLVPSMDLKYLNIVMKLLSEGTTLVVILMLLELGRKHSALVEDLMLHNWTLISPTCELAFFMMIWICSGLSGIMVCFCEGPLVVICILLFWGGRGKCGIVYLNDFVAQEGRKGFLDAKDVFGILCDLSESFLFIFLL